MRTFLSTLAALFLVLSGLSTAHAGKATTTTVVTASGVQQTTKTWTLKNGTQVSHLSMRTPDGKLASWQRTTTSAKHPDKVTVRGAFLGETFTVHQGNLGGANIKQTVFGKGENQVRRVEIVNAGSRPGYVMDEKHGVQTTTKQ